MIKKLSRKLNRMKYPSKVKGLAGGAILVGALFALPWLLSAVPIVTASFMFDWLTIQFFLGIALTLYGMYMWSQTR